MMLALALIADCLMLGLVKLLMMISRLWQAVYRFSLPQLIFDHLLAMDQQKCMCSQANVYAD